MLERFLPKETSFFDFFDQHAAFIVQTAKIFLDLVSQATLELSIHPNPIKSLEHQADEVIHQCLDALHKTFITPIDRDHIYRLVSAMDDVIDAIHAAYNSLIIFRLKTSNQELQNLARVVFLSSQKVEQAVRGLRDLSNGEAITAKCVEIHRLENEADELLHQAIAKLFDEEENAKTIIKWKEVYEALEQATDACEDVADAVQTIILESI